MDLWIKIKSQKFFYSKDNCGKNLEFTPWLIRLKFIKEELMNKNVTLLDIKSKFCNNWINQFKDLKKIKKEQRVILEKISKYAILSNLDSDTSPTIHLRLDMIDFNYDSIISFQELLLSNFRLKGIDGIKLIKGVSKDRYMKVGPDNKLINDNRYVIYTDGINLEDIRYLNGIDLNKVYCNSIVDIYQTFGIEAARNAILREFKKVFMANGVNVNFQHLSILVDQMTNNGNLTSIDRHGINKLDTDPLSRCSFEKTVDQLITAAVFNETDTMNSVSSRIIAGMVIKGGTGLCDILIDTDMFENSERTKDKSTNNSFNKLTKDSFIDSLINNDGGSTFMPI